MTRARARERERKSVCVGFCSANVIGINVTSLFFFSLSFPNATMKILIISFVICVDVRAFFSFDLEGRPTKCITNLAIYYIFFEDDV